MDATTLEQAYRAEVAAFYAHQGQRDYATQQRLEKFWTAVRGELATRAAVPAHERYKLDPLPSWFELCQDAPDFVRAMPADVKHALGVPPSWIP